MPWIVGIDEAGYGPNLGPLVMTSVACRVPDKLLGADLWHILRTAVRRREEANDGRLLIEDSKVVYSTTRGLCDLETGVLAALTPRLTQPASTLAHYVECIGSGSQTDLAGEVWYTGSSSLPVAAQPDEITSAGVRFEQAGHDNHVVWGMVRSVIVCTPRFNGLLDQWGTKGAVLGHGLTELLQGNLRADHDGEAIQFFVDKHGGRNNYAALLQHALPEGMPVPHQECMARSVYSIRGLERDVRLTFQPRADSEHFCVALASMVSKYLRELLMLEFNHFWRQHVPDLKPTAGYPGDATRFLTAIRPVMERLRIAETAVWRRR